MATKFVNLNLDEEQLALLNWLMEEPSEFRRWDDTLLAFIHPYDLKPLAELLLAIDSDYFGEGGIKHMGFNGEDVVFDVVDILKWRLELDPEWFYEEWSKQND